MTTLAELADRAQAALGDESAATWSQAQIEAWCLEAVGTVGAYFPRLLDAELETTAGETEYELPEDFLTMRSVEYPAGETPPQYLHPRRYTDEMFTYRDQVYDIVYREDGTTPNTLVLGKIPAETGEGIAIRYYARHPTDLEPAGEVTLPEHRLPILVAHVVWQAWRQLASQEMITPTSSSSLVMGQLVQNERVAQRDYQRLLEMGLFEGTPGGVAGTWKMDRWTRGAVP